MKYNFNKTINCLITLTIFSIITFSCMANRTNIKYDTSPFNVSEKKIYLIERAFMGETTQEEFEAIKHSAIISPLSGAYCDPSKDPIAIEIMSKFKVSASGEFPRAPKNEDEVSLLLVRNFYRGNGDFSKACISLPTLSLFPVTIHFYYQDQLYKYNINSKKYELISSYSYIVEREIFLFNIFRSNDELYNDENKRASIISARLLADTAGKL